jgi:hypothetical protein
VAIAHLTPILIPLAWRARANERKHFNKFLLRASLVAACFALAIGPFGGIGRHNNSGPISTIIAPVLSRFTPLSSAIGRYVRPRQSQVAATMGSLSSSKKIDRQLNFLLLVSNLNALPPHFFDIFYCRPGSLESV